MAETFSLDLVTPDQTIYSGEVEELVAPGSLGEFGVLRGHARMMSALVPGRLVYRSSAGEKTLVAAGGFAEVTGDKVTVLLDGAEAVEELDASRLQEEVTRLEEEDLQPGDERYDEWRQQLRYKQACLEMTEAG